MVHTTAHAHLLLFSNRGKVYRLRAHEVPMKERTARGTPIVNLIALEPGETIQQVVSTRSFDPDQYLMFVTKSGQVKKTAFSEYDRSRREGLDRPAAQSSATSSFASCRRAAPTTCSW